MPSNKKKSPLKPLPKSLPVQEEEIEALRITTDLSVSKWAEKYRKLSPLTTMLHGPWRNSNAPFLAEIMDSLSDSDTRQVTVQSAAQVGKSEIALNFFGWIVDQNPNPTLFVMPTIKDVKKRVATRIKPLFTSTPILLKHLGGNVNKINLDDATILDNMILNLATAGSASALADSANCYLILDEVGKYPSHCGQEADPVSLAKDRATTYARKSKVYICSTPKVEGDLIDREYKLGDQRQWWVKCVHCKRFHIMEWGNVHIEKLDGEWYDPSDYEYGELSWYVCPHCKQKWSESERWKSICAGKWLPGNCIIDKNDVVVGEIKKTSNRSYKITSLMQNPAIRPFGLLAKQWVEAQLVKKSGGGLKPLQGFINSRLAEPWAIVELTSEIEDVKRHIGNCRSGIVPYGVQIITCGVDVQKDHVWVSVEGWGGLSEVWTIYEGRIETGDTANIDNYDLLRQFLRKPFQLEQNSRNCMYIAKTAIDAGHNSEVVYAFCRQCTELDIIPVMGSGYTGASFQRAPIAGGTQHRYNLNLVLLKDRIHRLLFESTVPGAGYWHLPKNTPEDYLKQLTREIKRVPENGGVARWTLRSLSQNVNHLWDCKVYSTFAGELLGAGNLWSMEQIKDWEASQTPTQTEVPQNSGFLHNLPFKSF